MASSLSQEQLNNAALIYRESMLAGLTPAQAKELIGASYAESGLHTMSTNRTSGAAGLFQLLSSGYVTRAKEIAGARHSTLGVYDPVANIESILPSYVQFFKNHPTAMPGQAAATVEASGESSTWYGNATNAVLAALKATPGGGTIVGGGSASDFASGDLGIGRAAAKAGTQGLQDALGVLPGGPVLQQGASALGGPVNAAKDAISNVKTIAGAVSWIFDPKNILRVLEIIAGAVLVLVAVVRLTGASKAAGMVGAARAVPV